MRPHEFYIWISPEEVALAIVAEIVALRRGRETKAPAAREAGAMAAPALAEDPVCRMKVDPKTAPARSVFSGVTYYFCNPHCKTAFEKSPEKYLSSEARP